MVRLISKTSKNKWKIKWRILSNILVKGWIKRDQRNLENIKIVKIRLIELRPYRPIWILNSWQRLSIFSNLNKSKFLEFLKFLGTFTYKIFDIVSEILVFVFDIRETISNFEIFFDCNKNVWWIIWIRIFPRFRYYLENLPRYCS